MMGRGGGDSRGGGVVHRYEVRRNAGSSGEDESARACHLSQDDAQVDDASIVTERGGNVEACPCPRGRGGEEEVEGRGIWEGERGDELGGAREGQVTGEGSVMTAREGREVGEREGGGAALRVSGMRRMLHMFAGEPRLGTFAEAGEALGVVVDEVDVLRGGASHDVRSPILRDACERAVRAGEYEVVWIGTPCSSFSLWWLDTSMRTLRSRDQPEGLSGLPAREQAYLRKHNMFVEFSVRLARAAWAAGVTFVIENPPDRGSVGSPLFRWEARHHVPLWLLPSVRNLGNVCNPVWVTFPQCALGSEFRKLTTLMAAGPRARQLTPLRELRCRCVGGHKRVARGRDNKGKSEAAASAAYPVGMTGYCMWALMREGADQTESAPPEVGPCVGDALLGVRRAVVEQQRINERAAARFVAAHDETSGSAADDEGGARPSRRIWRAAPEAMPTRWVEREDVRGPRWVRRSTEALRFISRRRAEPERDEALARRPIPQAHEAPALERLPDREPTQWPAGAPARPVRIADLFHLGVYDDIQAELATLRDEMARAERAARSGTRGPTIARRTPKVWRAEESQPEWARGILWDTSNPNDCVPLQPFDSEDPADHTINAKFFQEWGAKLECADRDMLHQVAVTGLDSRSDCGMETVIAGHHGGLRNNYCHAREAVEADASRGWVTRGRDHLYTVPTRCVPKNVVAQRKWKMVGGELKEVLKWRVTTDDSAEIDGVLARNDGIDRSQWGDAGLPSVRTLAEAVAVVRAHASAMGVVASQVCYEKVALWALDLSDAYREVAVQRSEWHLQAYVWYDGVRLDKRALFGSAHLPGIFQRISSFVLAVAVSRIREYDAQHPYSEARQEWMRWREAEGIGGRCDMAMIYLDDGSGLSVLGQDEPLRGAADAARPTTSLVRAEPDGHVRLNVFADMSRGEVHLAIMRRTFQEAGWRVATEKVQYGLTLDLLGLGITTEGEGAMFVPEAKRLGMIEDITACQNPKGGAVERGNLDRLVGRTSHLGQVASEANAYLQPMYRMLHAKVPRRRKGGGVRKVRPRWVRVCGKGPTQRSFQAALGWFKAALRAGVSVPLAPRKEFPEIGEEGCAFLFTDAAREEGTGFGAFSVVRWDAEEEAEFLYLERRWDEEVRVALQANEISMPAGEAFGAVVMADALLKELQSASHMVVFTDSEATEAAINSANSSSPQLNRIVQWLFERWPRVQFLGVWQQGVRNTVADRLSRRGLDDVLQEVLQHGLRPRRIQPEDSVDQLLVEVWHTDQVSQ